VEMKGFEMVLQQPTTFVFLWVTHYTVGPIMA